MTWPLTTIPQLHTSHNNTIYFHYMSLDNSLHTAVYSHILITTAERFKTTVICGHKFLTNHMQLIKLSHIQIYITRKLAHTAKHIIKNHQRSIYKSLCELGTY